jgi:hypothetical protein
LKVLRTETNRTEQLPTSISWAVPIDCWWSSDEAGRRHYRCISWAGIGKGGHGLSATWFDYDGDGRPDLYVLTSPTPIGSIATKAKGDGVVRFKNVIADVANHSWSSMGDAADINNDGLMDR